MSEALFTFYCFLFYSFSNLLMDMKEGEPDEPFVTSVAVVIGNYIVSAVSFTVFWLIAKAIVALFS